MDKFMDNMEGTLNKFKDASPKKKVVYLIVALAAIGILFAVSAYIVGSFFSITNKLGGEEISPIAYALENNFGEVAMVSGVILLLGIFVFMKHSFVNTPKHYDKERKIWIMDSDTMGGQRYLTRKEMDYEFAIGNIKNITAPLFGQLSENGEAVVGWKKRPDGPSGNQNVLCIAPMGTGKTFGPVRVNLLQAIRRKESFVVTDPKMELYNSLGQYCIDNGMTVHVLNLADPNYSDFWNIFEETIDPDTERIDSTRLNDFSSIFMANSGDAQSDGFWYQSALNLISAVIGFVAYQREDEIIQNYVKLYRMISGVAVDDNTKEMTETMLGFPQCRTIIRNKAMEKGYDDDAMADLEERFKEINNNLKHRFNLETIYNTLLHFVEIIPELERIPDWHTAKTYYLTFKTNDSENVRNSAIQGTQLRFQIFSDKKLRDALSFDGLHCADVTKEHAAYFIILSDKTETTKPVASLFFSFLFKDVMDAWDKELSIAEATGKENPRLPLTVMLDEFYSIGVIGGNPKAFGTTMATSRSREIHIWIILQSYSQLAALYGPDTGNMIQAGCSTILYLGGNDPATTEFISSFVAGDSTVLTESHADTSGILGMKTAQSNLSVTKRSFITPEEAKRWRDDVLIAKQAAYLAKAKSLPWIQHPAYKDCRPISVFTQMRPVEERVIAIRREINKVGDPEKYVYDQIVEFGKRHNANLTMMAGGSDSGNDGDFDDIIEIKEDKPSVNTRRPNYRNKDLSSFTIKKKQR